MKKEKLSIVIVGFNEESVIQHSLESVLHFFRGKKIPYEIIFVDDGSTDNTLSIVKQIYAKEPCLKIISNKRNHGKGYVVKQGILYATGEVIIVTDADLAYPIEQIESFIKQSKTHPVVVGTRIHPLSLYLVNYTSFRLLFMRHLSSRIFNFYVKMLFHINNTDTQCGLKVMRCDVAKFLASRFQIKGFSYDVELFLIAKKHHIPIFEMPVQVRQSCLDSKVVVRKQALKMFMEILKIKWNDFKGVYR